MEIITLPENLNINTTPSIQVFNYLSENNLQRSKINLSKNTISFLRTGTKEVIGDDKTVLIDNKNFVLMKSGNCLMTEKISTQDKIYKSILLFFSDELIMDFLMQKNLYTNLSSAQRSFYIFGYDDFIQNFVKSLEIILTLPLVMQEDILKAKFEEIMLYLIHQNGVAFLNEIIQQIDNAMTRLTNVVENNKYNRLSLHELAFLANMSTSSFKREFHKKYQTTPIKWFNNQRLEYVAVLLKTTSKRPIELYEVAGYESFSNFIQVFKKKYGVTPKQYQNQP
jgi:AraC-like DNA-binding protein